MILPKLDQFEYINRHYGLNLTKNCSVVQDDGKRGQVKRVASSYIFIQWDGEQKESGPYHPTSELSYPEGEN